MLAIKHIQIIQGLLRLPGNTSAPLTSAFIDMTMEDIHLQLMITFVDMELLAQVRH